MGPIWRKKEGTETPLGLRSHGKRTLYQGNTKKGKPRERTLTNVLTTSKNVVGGGPKTASTV